MLSCGEVDSEQLNESDIYVILFHVSLLGAPSTFSLKMHFSSVVPTLVALLATSTVSFSAFSASLSNLGFGALQIRDSADPTDLSDLSFITSLASIGNSFASGIGAGSRIDWSSSWYDHSYPALINNDTRYVDASNRKFQFLACSGATAMDVLTKQAPSLSTGIDAVSCHFQI